MRLDRTVTVGNILQMVVLVAAILASYVKLSNEVSAISVKVDVLWSAFVSRSP